MTSDLDRRRAEIAGLAGIARNTMDAFGRDEPVPIETRDAILAGLGLPVATEGDVAASLDRVMALNDRLLLPLLTVDPDAPSLVYLSGFAPERLDWRLVNEAGTTTEGRGSVEWFDDAQFLRIDLPGDGYFQLSITVDGRTEETTLVAAPVVSYAHPRIAAGERPWGLAAQVVSLRTQNDLGVGDFGSIAEACRSFGRFGASFLGLSPLHGLFPSDRTRIGPYAPSTRLFLDPIHIDVTEFAAGGERDLAASLRSAPLADHAAVWRIKRPILDRAFAAFVARDGSAEFEAFRNTRGYPLLAHATFEALAEHFSAEGRGADSALWPERFKDATSAEVLHFRAGRPERVTFHAWLQWIAARQLENAVTSAKSAGMEIGLYGDLAVGADPGGSEAWTYPDRYAASLSVGAPPDPLAPQGQDWGIAGLNPIALAETGLAGFRDLLAANMRHMGALRIDHAFQLERLYFVPRGEPRLSGAFVHFPFEALLAALRLESHRAKCMVIGEDLGTAPHGFSDRMMKSGALSYRVLFFERQDQGAFKPPSAYPEPAIAVFTTHDLPTIAGWWIGRDIDWREKLGLMGAGAVQDARSERAADRRRLMEALQREGLVDETTPPSDPPLEAIVRYLARTRSSLAALQLEDVVGEVEQANIPGVVDAHPNWRRRLSLDLAAIAAPGGPLETLAKVFASERPAGRRAE